GRRGAAGGRSRRRLSMRGIVNRHEGRVYPIVDEGRLRETQGFRPRPIEIDAQAVLHAAIRAAAVEADIVHVGDDGADAHGMMPEMREHPAAGPYVLPAGRPSLKRAEAVLADPVGISPLLGRRSKKAIKVAGLPVRLVPTVLPGRPAPAEHSG